MLNEAHKANFETLQKAFSQGDVCLLECIDKSTGQLVPVVCAIQPSGDAEKPIEFVPFAKMFLGNPYEEVDPPDDGSDSDPDSRLKEAATATEGGEAV